MDRVGLLGPSFSCCPRNISAVVAFCFQILYIGFNCAFGYTMYIVYSYLSPNCYGTRVGPPGCEYWFRGCGVVSLVSLSVQCSANRSVGVCMHTQLRPLVTRPCRARRRSAARLTLALVLRAESASDRMCCAVQLC